MRPWSLLLPLALVVNLACGSGDEAPSANGPRSPGAPGSPTPHGGAAGSSPGGTGGSGASGGGGAGGGAFPTGGAAGLGPSAGASGSEASVGGSGGGGVGAGAPSGGAAGLGPGGNGAAGGGAGGQTCLPGAAACTSASTIGVCNASGTAFDSPLACPPGTVCDQGGCVGSLAWHLARPVDLQFVQEHPASQLQACGASAADDIAAGRVGCDARRSAAQLEARFGLFLGNSWLTFPGGPAACASSADVAAWRACVAINLAQVIARFHAQAPGLLAVGQLSEYIHRDNAPESWPSVCIPGSIGAWGPDTCIPDVIGSEVARQYLTDWGKAHLDAGIRAFVFGQARLMGGSAPGTSDVSAEGSAAFAQIIAALRAHAQLRGIPHVYFGAQAASSIAVAGVEQLDFITGAQHLEPAKGMLVQPLLTRGPFLAATWYGPDDWHDANILVNHRRLPVLLDYDNFSSDPATPDDIRRLAQVPTNAERGRVLQDHTRHAHLYDPLVHVSIPVSKTLGNNQGTTCQGASAWHFSASACGLVEPARQALDEAEATPTVAASSGHPPIRPAYWGQQLRGRDATVSWLFRVFLDRTPDPGGYAFFGDPMPALINEPCGARSALAKSLVTSSEFEAKSVGDEEFVRLLYRAFLLREAGAGETSWWTSQLATTSRSQTIDTFCGVDEAAALYAP